MVKSKGLTLLQRVALLNDSDIEYMECESPVELRGRSQINAFNCGKDRAFRSTVAGLPVPTRYVYSQPCDVRAEEAGKKIGKELAVKWLAEAEQERNAK